MRFLLFGRSRSGTTITYDILNEHPEIDISNQKDYYLSEGFTGGNKKSTPNLDEFEFLNARGFKFIHIYRDGRDSVSSGMRVWKEKVFKGGYRPWKDLNPKINSKDWADAINIWEKAKSFIDVSRYIDIKFEDYFDFPGRNSKKIANLLEIGSDKLINIERKLINIDEAHRGYYTEWVPDWKKTFHPDAIEALKFLGYI